ncbi:MAG TPA: nucleoside transporter C-terminal domain-containing protein [Thermoanaerobaculia bacterium]|nr:nucleoside transporter C-terminal domain-containing protein [Thermoanaerobaculia bacterium]
MRWIGLAGIAVVLAVALLLSRNRRAIAWRTVGWAAALQLVFAFLVLYWDRGKDALEAFSDGVSGAIAYADKGAGFLFGWLAGPMDSIGSKLGLPIGGYIFAFKVLPIIIFICAFFSILYHFGLIQRLVQGMAWVMQRSMKVSGAEALCVAANVFIGQTEAPVLIAPYIAAMTTSELLALMTGGMAHISGAVMLAYVTMGAPLKYLIAASVMAAPGTFLIAKILWPETEQPATMGSVRLTVQRTSANFIDAAAAGASQGMTLVLNIAAMLIAFVALVALSNGLLGWIGAFFGQPGLQIQTIFGWVLGPLAFLLGAPRQDAAIVGNLIANKTVINEFFAFAMMKEVVGQLSEKGKLVATFALCGFANFSSIGIQIGGIGGLAPTRRSDLARLGLRAMLAGSLTSFLTAAIAGILYGP